MNAKTLHITNGDSLTNRLNDLDFEGEIVTWREILCEGPTTEEIFSEEFISVRRDYLRKYEAASPHSYDDFSSQFMNFDPNGYDKIFLWFEYDLFCHVNLAAVCTFLIQKNSKTTILLVCSGKIEGSDKLFGLAELNDDQLMNHFNNPSALNSEHLKTLSSFWKIYNTSNHNHLLDISTDNEALPYLSNCINAQLKRFPKMANGLNWMELSILENIEDKNFSSTGKLVGWMLQNQMYYGFGNLQIEETIDKLADFIQIDNSQLSLTELGKNVLHSENSAYPRLKDETRFGGALKYDYFYNAGTNRLTKAHENS